MNLFIGWWAIPAAITLYCLWEDLRTRGGYVDGLLTVLGGSLSWMIYFAICTLVAYGHLP